MKKLKLIIAALMAIAVVTGSFTPTTARAAEKEYTYVWSHYVGWELWQYMSDSGIMKKWADREGVKIKITLINDYVSSINQYTAGSVDGCAMTIMDCLDMPAAGGVDSDILVVGDYSNGNDGIVLMNGKTFEDLKGRKELIVKGSVSSYLSSRGCTIYKMKDSDVEEVNTSDANIGATFASSGAKGACVTWNPILMQVRNLPNATMVFDSSKIPGEIQDLLVVRHDTPDAVKKALVGAWYEAVTIMYGTGKQTDEAIDAMAKFAGGTIPEFRAQMATTFMFSKPEDGVKFVRDPKLAGIVTTVSQFCFDHGLYDQSIKTWDAIGVELPGGKIVGNAKNVKVHYLDSYMQAAAAGKL
jgi:NitT/TauT family transport system substrate-binding protein